MLQCKFPVMGKILKHCFILGIFSLNSLFLGAQGSLMLTEPKSGIKLLVINQEYPLLKILIPGQNANERGIEVEFPEHVTGLNQQNKQSEHLYLVTNGNRNHRTRPVWKIQGNTLIYETALKGEVKMIAKARLDATGVHYTYEFTNHSDISYQNFQAVTCVKLYSAFSDVLLERTYVHHKEGFELLASETPKRLTMPLQQWLPCRYLVSYRWPVPAQRVAKDEDNITRYNKSRQVDRPVIATRSQDGKWIAATYTTETGNLWTNPERSCHHADPAIDLPAHQSGKLQLTTFLYPGKLEQLLSLLPKP